MREATTTLLILLTLLLATASPALAGEAGPDRAGDARPIPDPSGFRKPEGSAVLPWVGRDVKDCMEEPA